MTDFVLNPHSDLEKTVSSSDVYRCLFEEAADGIFVADAGGGRYLAVNARACELTGYSRADLLGMSIANLIAPEDVQRMPPRLDELERGRIVLSQRMLVRKDGTRFVAEISARRLSDGKLLGLLRDVTARIDLEAELRASEMRFRTLVQNSTDVIGLYAENGAIIYQSPAVQRVLGYEPHELVGTSIYSLIDPDQLAEARADHSALIATPGRMIRAERRYRHRDGSLRWVEIVCTNLLHDPTVRAIVKNYRDVTERKQQEAERETMRGELLHAQKMESMGRLAAGIAHDFNNMLTVILGGTESALASLGTEHLLSARLLDARAAALRSVELTRGLLTFARKQASVPAVLNVNQAVERTLVLLRRMVGAQIEVTWSPSIVSWTVLIDASQLDQILTNLVVNARDAIVQHGTVRVSTENVASNAGGGDCVRIVVADDGAGMDAETQARACEPFFTTKGPERGTGIGLSTVYGIVMQSGGRMELTSALGKGTTVSIDLPRHAGAADEQREAPTPAPVSSDPATVLVVEDEPSVLRLLEAQLQALGHTVIAASSAHEALEHLESACTRIDLVLADILMTRVNGVVLVRKLQVLYPNLKYVFMSGVAAESGSPIEVVLEQSAILPKPFSLYELGAAVARALNR